MQGGTQSIESIVRIQKQDIESNKAAIVRGEMTLESAPSLMAAKKKLGVVKRQSLNQQGLIKSLNEGLTVENARIEEKNLEIEEYNMVAVHLDSFVRKIHCSCFGLVQC